jgi:uncharacterized protein (TIGR00255 family)
MDGAGEGPAPAAGAGGQGRGVRSMTGFGRGEAEGGGVRCVVELRCLNHRSLELVVRWPRDMAVMLEERVREVVAARVRRGRCDAVVTLWGDAGGAVEAPRLAIDLDLAVQYNEALQEIARRLGLPPRIEAQELLALPGVCRLTAAPRDPEGDWALVQPALHRALAELERSRAAEGARLAAEVDVRLRRLQALGEAVGARVPLAVRAQWQRLGQQLAALLRAGDGGAGPEPVEARAAAELAAMAARADVSEELARIASHVAQCQEALERGGAIGRRCDFLAQELAREWATVGSKAVDAEIAARAVEARVIVEQIREQVQNLE